MPYPTEWRIPRLLDPEEIWGDRFPVFNRFPEIDLYEEGNELVLKANLPGINPDDVEVFITRDKIQLKGEFSRSDKEKREGYYRSERSYGSFNRTIPLPVNVKHRQAKASTSHGVLEIRVPKEDGETSEFTRLKVENTEEDHNPGL